MSEKKRITISIEQEIYDKLQSEAEKNRRYMSSQVAAILEEHYKGKPKPAANKQ